MCVVSMICDHYNDKFRKLIEEAEKNPWITIPPPNSPMPMMPTIPTIPYPPLEKVQDFVKDFKDLYERAKKYDQETGQPDCELDEKKQTLKKLADMLGVKIDFL